MISHLKTSAERPALLSHVSVFRYTVLRIAVLVLSELEDTYSFPSMTYMRRLVSVTLSG